MRADFNKVVNDKTRRGSKNPSLKTGQKLNVNLRPSDDEFEDQPKRAPESKRRQYGYDSKFHRTNLAPLKGFLRKNVGRPWDKVYSEFRTAIDPRTKTGDHLISELRSLVEEHCTIGPDKLARQNSTSSYRVGARLVWGFYVHPARRTLCYQQPKRQRDRREWRADNITRIWLTPDVLYVLEQDVFRPERGQRWVRRSFKTARDDWPAGLAPGRLVKAGDRYLAYGRLANSREVERVLEAIEKERAHILATGQRLHSEDSRA